jgi:transposase
VSLQLRLVPPIPEDTVRVARAAFPDGNPYLRLRDELGTIFHDADFADLYPLRGQPALAPWRLALVTVLQFREDLSDRTAADAVRARIDWKYLLGLELTDPGFDASVLCEFRSRLLAGGAEGWLLEKLLDRCKTLELLKARGRRRTDSTQVLARVRATNRLGRAIEALRHGLNSLAVVAPDWLRDRSHPDWVERYGLRHDESRIPTAQGDRQTFADRVGEDGHTLLAAIYGPGSPSWLGEVPAIETLRRVWVQQFAIDDGRVRWRTDQDGVPPARLFISSPHDVEARYGKKSTTTWVGYKVHLTETCEDEAPHLIVHVATTPAPVADGDVTPAIHQAPRDADLLPGKHIADTAYVDAELLADGRREYDIDLIGPTRPDYRWQSRAGEGFAASDFTIDWDRQQATCPEGRTSLNWSPAVDRGHNEVIKIKFSAKDCGACPSQARCTEAKRRSITVRPRDQFEALEAARSREASEEYRLEYNRRAGIEGTISQGVRSFGLRRSRYIGEAKVHLQHIATATAINVARISDWLEERPREVTRRSAFMKLMAPADAA